MSAADKFTLDLSAFKDKALGATDQVVRKIVLDVGTRVVMRSPVGDPSHWLHPAPKGYTGGRFRANWQYGAGAPASGTVSDHDASGGKTVQKLAASVPKNAAAMVHFISNNLPYAMRLETGWSRQAPAGMVAITVREFAPIVAAAAQAMKGSG